VFVMLLWSQPVGFDRHAAGSRCNSVDDVRSLRCDSCRGGLAAGVGIPQPGGGGRARGPRPAKPDPVVVQGKEDALHRPARKCGGRKTAPLLDIPERELGALGPLAPARHDSEEAASRAHAHKSVLTSCHLFTYWCGGTASHTFAHGKKMDDDDAQTP
jgi:hypothetical protein